MKPSLVIIGLGNPGAAYAATRHNAGFQAIDVLSEAFGQGEWQEKQKLLSHVQEARLITVPVLLVKPQTFMNRSGEAVRKIVDFYKLLSAEQVLILCDDIDIPLGTIRLRMTGGPGTHNGLKSITQTLGEQFPRLRIGIGAQPSGADLATWVLSKPSSDEQLAIAHAMKQLPELITSFVLGKLPNSEH